MALIGLERWAGQQQPNYVTLVVIYILHHHISILPTTKSVPSVKP